MLRNSFIILEKISYGMEQRIWRQGIRTWSDFIAADNVEGVSSLRKKAYDRDLIKAENNLALGNIGFFSERLPSTETWRLYKEFYSSCIFLDIETGYYRDDVVIIGLGDGDVVRHLVQGFNLNQKELTAFLERFPIAVTFNGASFDIPILKRRFLRKMRWPIAHIDLRHLCFSLGFYGGLKQIEHDLGILREYAHSYGNPDPVSLWHVWRESGDERCMEALLEYNSQDVSNLMSILDIMYSRRIASIIE